MIDLTQYTIEELDEIRNNINYHIDSYVDGYEYICKVRSYGRIWNENITNSITLQELCDRYSGDDGIVDVFSTNPNLSHIQNYGDLKYIKSKEDYQKWSDYQYLKHLIPQIEKEWEEWDNRDNVPFNQRPHFAPIYSKEVLENYKKELEEYDMSFTPPTNYVNHQYD
jgi:hypothetical protein